MEHDRLVENAAQVGAALERLLADLVRQHICVGHVESLGLFATVELVCDRVTKAAFPSSVRLSKRDRQLAAGVGGEVSALMKDRGFLLRGTPTSLKIVPPLTITAKELDLAFGQLHEVLDALDGLAKCS
jgi:4-aminobutyrate aminotransferase-like enzyme